LELKLSNETCFYVTFQGKGNVTFQGKGNVTFQIKVTSYQLLHKTELLKKSFTYSALFL